MTTFIQKASPPQCHLWGVGLQHAHVVGHEHAGPSPDALLLVIHAFHMKAKGRSFQLYGLCVVPQHHMGKDVKGYGNLFHQLRRILLPASGVLSGIHGHVESSWLHRSQ